MKKKISQTALIITVLSVIIVLQLMVFINLKKWKPAPQRPLPPGLQGYIAIVIDDFGYHTNNFSIIEKMKYPLTVSILPNLPYSVEAAERLNKLGFEVILHLPMEPIEKINLEKDTVLTKMSAKTIKNIFARDINSIPFLKGVSNHMGSKTNANQRIMDIIFDETLKNKLYFLDSYVSPKSVCQSSAKRKHLPFAKRDIFLDNNERPEYIRQQIELLKKKARERGKAIGIGHDKITTVQILKEELPKLEKEGFKLVFVSQLLS